MKKLAQVAALFTIIFGLQNSFAAEAPPPSKEERERMAANHEKMAQCLRSDKTMEECHEEWKKNCKEGGCHWNSKGKKKRGSNSGSGSQEDSTK